MRDSQPSKMAKVVVRIVDCGSLMFKGESKCVLRWSTAYLKRKGTPTLRTFAETNKLDAKTTLRLISQFPYQYDDRILNS